MRICIDVSQAVYGTGVGDYTKNLVTHLLRVDSENEYVLFGGALRRRGELQQLFPPTKNSTLKSLKIKNYYFDNDIFIKLLQKNKHFYFAKVKTGIVHLYCTNLKQFANKQLRRINDYSYHLSQNQRSTNLKELYLQKILLFQLQCLLVFPIIYQTIKGFIKTRDPAWAYHLPAVYLTWFIYLYGYLKGKINPSPSNRTNWQTNDQV